LAANATLRIAHRLGRDFDDEYQVRAGDDELLLRATEKALSGPTRRTQRLRLAVLVAVAAAVSLASAAAAMGVWTQAPPGGDRAPKLEKARRVAPSLPRLGSAAESAYSVGERPAPSDATRIAAPLRPESASDRVKRIAPATDAEPALDAPSSGVVAGAQSAAELFREAGVARRGGDVPRASSLYAELQARFPGSNEAVVSRVSLGKLFLSSGRASDAERQFASYLASGATPLEEEALVGRADALSRLGESGEEARVWQRLLLRSPSSVYAARAEERLRVLAALPNTNGR
jgi:TolA-binding protein